MIFVERGRDFQGGTLKDAKAHGARQAFPQNTDKKGYVQEIALPWKLLTRDGSPLKAGQSLVITV